MGNSALTASFVQGVGDAYALDDAATELLGPLLDELVVSARAAWPKVHLSGAEFAAHLAHVAPDVDDLGAALREMNTDDLYLAAACVKGDDAAVRSFEAKILPRAARAAARVDGDPSFIQEVCSEVRVKLLVSKDGKPRIAAYLGRGPLAHWVQVTSMRVAQTFKRKVRKEEAHGEVPDIVSSILEEDPELQPFAEQLRAPFSKAFAEALGELSARERNVLRMYLIDEVSAEQIGVMYRVHRATVARWIAQARRKVHSATKRRLAEEVQLGPTSFESVMGQMMNGVDLSIASFLSD